MSAENAWKVAMECGAALASERAEDHKRQSKNASRSDAYATAWEHDRAARSCLSVASDCEALPMPPAFRAEVEAEELRGALSELLRPFADEAKSRCVDDEAWRNTDTIRCVLTIGLLRNVVALLSRLEAKGEPK